MFDVEGLQVWGGDKMKRAARVLAPTLLAARNSQLETFLIPSPRLLSSALSPSASP